MKRIRNITLVLMLLFTLAGLTQTVSAGYNDHRTAALTYTVLVGAEDPVNGVEDNQFFPKTLLIHQGDTVTWQANSIELHTVTFLAGRELPSLEQPDPNGNPSPLRLNPDVANPAVPDKGLYDGKTYANSGLIGNAPGLAQTFSLTFTRTGVYEYVCVVHGQAMSGKIVVLQHWKHLYSPEKISQIAARQIHADMAQASDAIKEAEAMAPEPIHNADGTTSYRVMMGYMKGNLELMRFFPSDITVHPGDSITWDMGQMNMAPHTVTFLNNTPDPGLLIPVPQQSAPPLLYFNPLVLAPVNFTTLSGQGYINSGLLVPMQNPSATITVGNVSGRLPYVCLLHDESGMKGTVTVTAK